MSRLDPPTVLLDASFVAALTNHDEPFHTEAVASYSQLLDRYEHAEILLAATSDTLEALPPAIRASLFSPVSVVHIAEQHRNAALDVAGSSVHDPELATLLVILRRERIRCVASFDERLLRFDIEVIPVPPTPGDVDEHADGAPLPGPDGTSSGSGTDQPRGGETGPLHSDTMRPGPTQPGPMQPGPAADGPETPQ